MFSTKPTKPTTFDFAFRKASVFIRPTTTPAPPISTVIASIPAGDFREIPPVSKTTPFPTKAKGFASPAPRHSSTITLVGLGDPCPTPSNAFIPRFLRSFSSRV